MTDTTEATEATEDQPRPKRSKSTNSWVFTNGWAIIDDSGSYNICQYPTASGSCGRRYKRVGATTSSIIYHLQTQHSVDRNSVFEAVNTGPLDMMLRTPLAAPFSADMFQERLLRLVIAHALPFSIVESNEFQELLRLASRAPIPNAITLPSRRTLCQGLEAMFDVYKDRVMQQLESLPDLSYTLDAWTSEQKVPILGVTAHWITDSWEQQSYVIGFEPLSGPHSGANLAMAFVNVLRDMRLEKKPFFITTDNASNMTSMAQHVEQILQAPDIFIAAKHRIGCIAHIINLAAQVIIQDALKAPAPENDSDDDYEGEGTVLEDPGKR